MKIPSQRLHEAALRRGISKSQLVFIRCSLLIVLPQQPSRPHFPRIPPRFGYFQKISIPFHMRTGQHLLPHVLGQQIVMSAQIGDKRRIFFPRKILQCRQMHTRRDPPEPGGIDGVFRQPGHGVGAGREGEILRQGIVGDHEFGGSEVTRSLQAIRWLCSQWITEIRQRPFRNLLKLRIVRILHRRPVTFPGKKGRYQQHSIQKPNARFPYTPTFPRLRTSH